MSTTPRSADHGNPNQPSDAILLDKPISESANSSAGETPSRRGSRTVNACEQCQRRKTKCTGQPSPCEACEKMGLACHFDAKTNWKTRSRATYSAEDGRLQYMLNAVLSSLKYSDEKVLNGLMNALRQNESPETVAMHLRNNIDILLEHGHISNTAIDQADLISLAARISNPATLNGPASGPDSNPEVQSHHINKTDLGISGFEYEGRRPDEEHWQQRNRVSNRQYQSSFDPSWDYAFGLPTDPGQNIHPSPWTQVQASSAQMSYQPYHDNPPPNFADGPHALPPNAMHQSYYVNPYSTVHPGSIANQFYLPRQSPTLYQQPANIDETGTRSDETTVSSLSIVHEGMASQFEPRRPLTQTYQQPTSRRNTQPQFSQNPSSGGSQQRRRSTANADQTPGDNVGNT